MVCLVIFCVLCMCIIMYILVCFKMKDQKYLDFGIFFGFQIVKGELFDKSLFIKIKVKIFNLIFKKLRFFFDVFNILI